MGWNDRLNRLNSEISNPSKKNKNHAYLKFSLKNTDRYTKIIWSDSLGLKGLKPMLLPFFDLASLVFMSQVQNEKDRD